MVLIVRHGSHADPEVQRLSQLLREIAQVHPYKRRRWRNLARDHPELFRRAIGVLGIEFFEEVLLDYGDTRGPLWRTVEHFAAQQLATDDKQLTKPPFSLRRRDSG